jgi:hypothetical protein
VLFNYFAAGLNGYCNKPQQRQALNVMGNLKTTIYLLLLTSALACRQGTDHLNSTPINNKEKPRLEKGLLISHKWELEITNTCVNYFTFKRNMTGLSFDCERDLNNNIQYKIIKDTLYIDEYTIPTEDNPAHKTIMEWSGKYIYTGHSLRLVTGRLYEISGKFETSTPTGLVEYSQK